MATVSEAFSAAFTLHQQGRLIEAEALYRQILYSVPQHSDSLYLLGHIAYQTGRYDITLGVVSQAIKFCGDDHREFLPLYYNMLGLSLRKLGHFDQARSSFLQALSISPNFAEASVNLKEMTDSQGQTSGTPQSAMSDIRIICYEDVDSWILGKFAKRMRDSLQFLGKNPDISKVGSPYSPVAHHIIYYGAEYKWSPIETFMITHLDEDWKLEKVRRQLDRYDMGVCMSLETRERLAKMGMPAERLCYINPAQDGVIHPRPLVLGITCRVHSDGRKKQDTIVDVLKEFPTNAFILKIMGDGWDNQVASLRSLGYTIEYHECFDYEIYTKQLMPSLDYFLYWTYDEGAMAFLDAVAAGVKTIVTPQGYHLDVPDGIDHPIKDIADFKRTLWEIHTARLKRSSRVSDWTWLEYSWRHLIVWDYLLADKDATFAADMETFFEKTLQSSTKHKGLLKELKKKVPSDKALLEAIPLADSGGLSRGAAYFAQKGLTFYPKNAKFRDYLLPLYPKRLTSPE